MTSPLQHLEAVAKRAHGERWATSKHKRMVGDEPSRKIICKAPRDRELCGAPSPEANMDHIATFDPPTCQALIEIAKVSLSALEEIAEHGCCVMHSDDSCPGCESHNALKSINALLAKLEVKG